MFARVEHLLSNADTSAEVEIISFASLTEMRIPVSNDRLDLLTRVPTHT